MSLVRFLANFDLLELELSYYMMKKYLAIVIFILFFSFGDLFCQITSSSDSKQSNAIIDNFELNKSIKMYPNPVGDNLFIDSKIPITKIQIYSLLGQLVKEKKSNLRRISLRDLNSGIYMIKIFANDKSVTKKLIKR